MIIGGGGEDGVGCPGGGFVLRILLVDFLLTRSDARRAYRDCLFGDGRVDPIFP